MRQTSEAFRDAAFAQETGEAVITLLTVTHDSLATPIRLSSDPTVRLSDDPLSYGTISRDETYLFLPFEVTLGDDRDDVPTRVELRLDNADRALVGLLREVSSPPVIEVEMVLSGSPDLVEVSLPALRLADVRYDAAGISAELVVDGLQGEPYPAARFDRSRFPGLF